MKTCRNCGKEFETRGNKNICDACYEKIRQQLRHSKPHICPVCGSKADHVYCGSMCKDIANAVRARERYEACGRAHQKPTTRLGIHEYNARRKGMTYGEYMGKYKNHVKKEKKPTCSGQ